MSEQLTPAEPASRAVYQPAGERTVDAKRRGQAIAGAAAGLAVIAVLVGVFVWVDNSGREATPAPAAAGAGSAATDPSGDPNAAAPTAAEPGAADPGAANPGAANPAGPGAATPRANTKVDPALGTKPVVKAGTGKLDKLVVTPIVKGTGPAVVAGQTLTVQYVGVLHTDGKEFDSSWKAGKPAQFPIGVGQVIKGWDQGLVGVPVGSRVQLDIPAALAYGDPAPQGYPNGALRFVVDVLAAK